jgi:hypothetical protein
MKPTNSLTSHHGESRSFRADKMMPKETIKFLKTNIKGEHKCKAGTAKWFKRFYKKKNRNYNKNIDNFIDRNNI